MKFETEVVHAGHRIDPATGSMAPPIYLSTTFARDPQGTPLGGHTYIRESNPAQEQLEEALAPLEGGEGALVFASGMAAGVALLQTLPPGAHAIFPDDAYYGFRIAAEEFLPNWGIRSDFVAMEDLAKLAAAVRPETRLVWLESPSNPLLKVVDLAGAADVARRAGALSVVDNTFATPALQRPLALGVDVVTHSTAAVTPSTPGVEAVLGRFELAAVLDRGRRRIPLTDRRLQTAAAAVAVLLQSFADLMDPHFGGLLRAPRGQGLEGEGVGVLHRGPAGPDEGPGHQEENDESSHRAHSLPHGS
jgi:Cys/Met metabolism PLP-dependent enzyme